MSLTIAQVRAAQANDTFGIAAVLTEMEERISRLASQAARRLNDSGSYREDFAQDAREALFLALPRAEGDDVDRVIGFLYSSMADALKDKVRAARYVGVDKDAVKVFMSVLEDAEGDPYKAEQLAQTVPPKGLRLSADRANAARLAWQGAVSIDKESDDDASIADTLAVVDETPQVRPKVGRGAVLEALSVLERHVSVPRDADTREALLKALDAMQTGFVTPDQADTMADCVRVPANPQTRRYVLDAVAILHSAASTADDGDLVEELRDVSDERRDERAARIGTIRTALDKMGAQQRDILAHSFGIGGVEEFGWGDGCDLTGLAERLGTTYGNAKKQRSAAKVSFAKYYIALAAATEDEALALAEAATEMRKPGGRK
jgi:RNA polymerase sigma factor (sigma-70 family)